jgi:hypothetical protein
MPAFLPHAGPVLREQPAVDCLGADTAVDSVGSQVPACCASCETIDCANARFVQIRMSARAHERRLHPTCYDALCADRPSH